MASASCASRAMMTDSATGTVYTDRGNGQFESDDGQVLGTGWQILVGLDNFLYPFQNQQFGAALLSVTIWTFAFAILTVGLSFILGLFLAIGDDADGAVCTDDTCR